MNVKSGDIVAWWQEPHVPLKVISDPYPFAGGGRNRDGAEDCEEKG